jgi:eukaryotic-like serine/threonine-protein kinase
VHQVIADRFEIERLVGTGGMGEVFRARDRATGGLVAVKVLHRAMHRDAERFRREARLLADVSHPRIVTYVAHGVAGDRPYLAMEWLEGEDLAERVERSGLSLHESVLLGARVAEGLVALHERGIVHRDVKPSNIFLPGGRIDDVKILDLGVARLVHATIPSTRSGIMVGTPGYMAPEQARGEKEIDGRADLFSLGCVLFECLAGRPAFAGDNIAALLAKILLEEPPTLGEVGASVPPALDDLVARMLAKHPSARPQNASAVLRELDRLAAVEDGPARHPSTPRQRALTGSERRLVSVVMAAYESAPDEAAPLSANETLAASFDPRAVAAGYGGDAELLADGSIVVTLSGKGGASDQAAHAARCALALRSHMIGAHVALATGLATVTSRSCVGDVIERAAALLASARGRQTEMSDESIAGQSPVFLDETTAGLLDVRFDVGGDERGLFIRGLRDREARPRTLLGRPTPFVGRERELATLLGIFEECKAEPVARAILVTGQPGAGKSRMTTEALRQITRSHEAEIWLTRGEAMSEGSPFSLLARLIRRGSSITGAEPLVVRQQKLKARVARHVPEADVQRVTEFLGEIASVRFSDEHSVQLRAARHDSALMGDQMRRAFADIVFAESAASPLILVLEDLQWGDLPSVSFIDAALRAASEQPFMVLAVARGEVHDVFPHLWEERSLQEIRLGPLVRRAGERLIREVLGEDVRAEEVTRLLDRAAGNVFYLEELIRAYAEDASRRSLRPPPSMMVTPPSGPALDAEAWSVPGTVLAMVEARLERLDPMARRVLRAASVFGEVFWRGGVISLTGGDCKTSEVAEWLSELSRREIVHRRELSRFPGEVEYAFRHALVREAAYQMLTPEDLLLGHRLAADWLEQAGEHDAMVLGEHFERGGATDRAPAFYERAAVQALEGHDFSAARARADRAIHAGATGEAKGRLHLLLAEASRWSGEHESALANARAALTRLSRGTDGWCAALAEAVEAAGILGHRDEARVLASQVRPGGDAEGAPMTTARVVAMARIAMRILGSGAFELASALINDIDREAHELASREPAARAFLLGARSCRAQWLGDVGQAAVLAQEAVTEFELVGDVRNAARQRNVAGLSLVQLGAFPSAEAMLERALADAQRLGLPGAVNETKLCLAQLYGRMQRSDEALDTVNEVIGGFMVQRDRVGEGRARAYLAGFHHLAQRFMAAEEEALRALPLLDAAPPYRAALLGLLALSRADRGDGEGAHAAGRDAMEELEGLGGTMEGEALVRLGYAEGLSAKGDLEGSRRAIAVARNRLLARAAGIDDPEWKRFFMERLAEHTRILVRAGEWLV